MKTPLYGLQETWQQKWPEALACWSRYVKLSQPRWCLTQSQEKQEGLTGSFAMIRLNDHAVVVSLPQIEAHKLTDFATEILAHEIGHHVYAPGDLLDNARLLARTRRGLPSRESFAPMIANLYTDLLINDRLQRACNLRMAQIYKILQDQHSQGKNPYEDRLWTLYMRIYEILWSLPKGELARGPIDASLDADALLGSRLIRSYSKDWVRGAGRFAMLCLTYLLEDTPNYAKSIGVWMDATMAGAGAIPDGLIDIEDDEIDGAIHPSMDPELTGLKDESLHSPKRGKGGGSTEKDMNHREPVDYGELLKALGVEMSDADVAINYYRERARPHLVPFPEKPAPQSTEPQAEGLEEWSLGSPLEQIDWLHTAIYSPHVVPGVTTVQRIWSEVSGGLPETVPLDLYIGVDCSGSMLNPAVSMSHPVLAGAIIALSALRAGAKVKVVLSGEPGEAIGTDGFSRNEKDILSILTGYLGSGYSFGIHRLADTFTEEAKRPVHILIVTDHDIYLMLEQENAKDYNFNTQKTGRGWDVALQSLHFAGGGGTYVLHMEPEHEVTGIARMKTDGWNVHCVREWDDIIAFARAFAHENYARLTI